MTRKVVHIVFGFFFIHLAVGQVTLIIDELPEDTHFNKSIYISGNFENWSGGQENYKLSNINNRYFITIPEQKSPISFKFTLGNWDSVECDMKGQDIENRTYSFENKKDTLKIKIQKWQDQHTKISTANKQVSILKDNFEIPQLDRKRRIWIYLPPNYDVSKERYPVLYMHDGQNLFDNSTAYAGEWGIDETLSELYAKQQFKLIVIGIDNGQETRMNEYSPWDNSKFGKGEGQAYMEFVVQTLKPYIDSHFRTLVAKENTVIMGSSMGGLISHFAGLTYPDVFGKIGVFSPSFWYAKSCFELAKTNSKGQNAKMYFLVGNKEGSKMVSNMKKMIKTMEESGFEKDKIKSKIVRGAEHNEQFWREEFSEAVLWLFDK